MNEQMQAAADIALAIDAALGDRVTRDYDFGGEDASYFWTRPLEGGDELFIALQTFGGAQPELTIDHRDEDGEPYVGELRMTVTSPSPRLAASVAIAALYDQAILDLEPRGQQPARDSLAYGR